MAAKDGGETDEQGQVPSGEAATSLTGPGHNDPILMSEYPDSGMKQSLCLDGRARAPGGRVLATYHPARLSLWWR